MIETEILGQLDALLAQLPDDAARERVMALLHARHGAPPSTVNRQGWERWDSPLIAASNPTTLGQVWVGETKPSPYPAGLLRTLSAVHVGSSAH